MKELERFEAKYIPEPNTGCWLWTSTQQTFGYGAFRFRGGYQKAHRVAWILYRGVIPDNLCVLHKCDTPTCVNPDHLFLGSRTDNNADCIRKGRNNNQRKTHCAHGHVLSGYNLIITKPCKSRPRPQRQCRECLNAAQRRQNLKRKMERSICPQV